MKKYAYILIIFSGILLMPHFSHAAVLWDTTANGTSTQFNLGADYYNVARVNSTAPFTLAAGQPVYVEIWGGQPGWNTGFSAFFQTGDHVTHDDVFGGWTTPTSASGTDALLQYGYPGGTGATINTGDLLQINTSHGTNFYNFPVRGNFYASSSYTTNGTAAYEPWICVTTDATYSDCAWNQTLNPIVPIVTWVFPTQSTTTSDFTSWNLNLVNVTTTDSYRLDVFYSPFGSSVTYNDFNIFNPSVPTLQLASFRKSIALGAFGTSTSWIAYASLTNLTESSLPVTTSTAITFTINSATTTYTGWYSPTYTHYATGTIAGATAPFATSTCGWGDVPCAIGNIFDNIMNFIFGINPGEINVIAGFNLAEQPPFDAIGKIQNAFASVGVSGSTAASSTITTNLGHGTIHLTFFDPAQAKALMGPTVIATIRALLLAGLLVLMVLGFYVEIKKIFGPHKS